MATTHPDPLVALTRSLGDPDRDLAILAEGNTSRRTGDSTFTIKASGVRMQGIGADGFVEVDLEPLTELLDGPGDLPLGDVRARLTDARIDPDAQLTPSIETLVHASCLALTDATYVAHTHPTAVNALLCADDAAELLEGTLFPDEAVILGADAVFVPYASPGLPLGVAVHEQLRAFLDTYGEAPKLVYLSNHGIAALGSSPEEVEAVTDMAVKAARIRAAVRAHATPNPLGRDEVLELVGRSDEVARRKLLFGGEDGR